MKKLKLIAFALLVVLLAATNSFSQGTFSFHFGPSIPSGNFKDESSSRGGAAALGLDLGVQYVYPLSEKGLGLFAGVDLAFNGLKKSYRNDIEDAAPNADFTFPKYLNLPVSGGLNYMFKVNEKVSIYGKGGLVASFLKITNMKVSQGSEEETDKYDLSTNLGYTIGGGFILNDKIDLSLTYLGLGEHEISGTADYGHGVTDKLERQKVDVGVMTITIGFKF